MIDRITIYINDVEFEDVETRLDLSPSGIAQDGSFKYASTIKNLKFTYAGKQLKIAGSLHKYAKGIIILYLPTKKRKTCCMNYPRLLAYP